MGWKEAGGFLSYLGGGEERADRALGVVQVLRGLSPRGQGRTPFGPEFP